MLRFGALDPHCDLHVTPAQFALLHDKLAGNGQISRDKIIVDWLDLIHLNPDNFRYRKTNIIVDWERK